MPAADSPAVLVARFLRANHYKNDTLDAFIVEAGLPPDAGTTRTGDLTIEKVLEEKKVVSTVTTDSTAPLFRKAIDRRIILDLCTLYCGSKAESQAS
ncbi:MAG: hypothetical protein Q9195_000999 [Heterodermia aff. obscurata]